MSNKEDDLISALRAQTSAISAQTEAINKLCEINQELIAMMAEQMVDGDGEPVGADKYLDDDES